MNLKILAEIPPWEWPEGTDKLLLNTFRDNQADENDRLLAAELAGNSNVIDGELVDVLMSTLQDDNESEKIRAKAVISLGPVLEMADIDGFDDPDDVPISESRFLEIQESLRKLYLDAGVPKEVRRRILEASVRAPQNWHQGAVRAAYASGDAEWMLTAVFSMRSIRGFDEQILEALTSDDEKIHYEAVCAAGEGEIDAAWSHVSALVSANETDYYLLLAAIDAVAGIRPREAGLVLDHLLDSDDEDIVDAVNEALALANGPFSHLFDDEEDDEFLH